MLFVREESEYKRMTSSTHTNEHVGDSPQASQASQPSQPALSQSGDVQQTSQAPQTFKVILASASPRRKELLENAGITFSVLSSDIDETLEPDLLKTPHEAAKKLAERKAGAVVQELLVPGAFSGMGIVLGADTMVVKGGTIFGKPKNLSDAKHMLRALSGGTHEVITAVSVWMISVDEKDEVSLGFRTFAESSQVVFHELSDGEISDYLKCGESFDKAGAYAAQGEGARLISEIKGDISTVIGLPIERLLKEFPDLVSAS